MSAGRVVGKEPRERECRSYMVLYVGYYSEIESHCRVCEEPQYLTYMLFYIVDLFIFT